MHRITISTANLKERAAPADRSKDYACALLRIGFSFLLLYHGFLDVGSGAQFVIHALPGAGIPEQLVKLTYIVEIIALLMIIFGVWARAAALAMALNLAIAIPFIYLDEAFSLWVRTGWMLELHLLYLATAVVVALQGAGHYSIGGKNGRWN